MRPAFPREVQFAFWSQIRAGVLIEAAAEAVGASRQWGRKVFNKAGGVNPMPVDAPQGRFMSIQEREQLLDLHAGGRTPSEIARELGRSLSTITRDLARGATKNGYRPSVAQHAAESGRCKPRGNAKLATNLALRREVQARLEAKDSPEQIAGRLKLDFPGRPEMHVCAETIYQSLYVQARGGLKRELTTHLRTARSRRKPHRKGDERRGRIADMINIAERDPEVDTRKIPGHWEGDLIIGSVASNSAVGTLVERTSGFTLLLHLPNGHSALEVQKALVDKILTLPEQLRLSLTWDQGREMANHKAITEATGLSVYFCDPHSPWQRGTNENTNGLLRQYLPKGQDLTFYGPGMLDNIAAELNARPRKRHAFLTPAEVLDKLLSDQAPHHEVA